MGCQQSNVKQEREPQPSATNAPTATNNTNSTNNNMSAKKDAKDPTREKNLPPVKPGCWYDVPFIDTASATTSITEVHYENKGRVLFATRAIPTHKSDLDALPQRRPKTIGDGVVDAATDHLYGMAYLHSTPAYVEYYWRSRVTHMLEVKAGKARTPEAFLKPGNAFYVERQAQLEHDSKAKSREDKPKEEKESAFLSPNLMKRSEASVYNRPFFDTLVGVRVLINDELVIDRYPGPRSLPQCTCTLDASDAFDRWVAVPIVLLGYVNHETLEVIDVYRTLSLTFVEELLERLAKMSKGKNTKKSSDAGAAAEAAATTVTVKVEVVYGCRSEAFFCTDFLSHGTCKLRLDPATATEPLTAYAAKLRALIQSHPAGEQLIFLPHYNGSTNDNNNNNCSSEASSSAVAASRRPHHLPPSWVRTCVLCGCPLEYRCTVCGAECCGSQACMATPLVGYPCGCSLHKAMRHGAVAAAPAEDDKNDRRNVEDEFG